MPCVYLRPHLGLVYIAAANHLDQIIIHVIMAYSCSKTVFHVKITPSPLIAWIRKGSDRQVLTSDFLPIDIRTSGDPDHDPDTEDTEVMKEVFCYPTELYDIPEELDRSEDLVSRNLTFFYDSGQSPTKAVAIYIEKCSVRVQLHILCQAFTTQSM